MREFGTYIPGVMGPARLSDALRSQEAAKADKSLVVEAINAPSNNVDTVSAGNHDLRSGYVVNPINKGAL